MVCHSVFCTHENNFVSSHDKYFLKNNKYFISYILKYYLLLSLYKCIFRTSHISFDMCSMLSSDSNKFCTNRRLAKHSFGLLIGAAVMVFRSCDCVLRKTRDSGPANICKCRAHAIYMTAAASFTNPRRDDNRRPGPTPQSNFHP